jgi:hypothetical protein
MVRAPAGPKETVGFFSSQCCWSTRLQARGITLAHLLGLGGQDVRPRRQRPGANPARVTKMPSREVKSRCPRLKPCPEQFWSTPKGLAEPPTAGQVPYPRKNQAPPADMYPEVAFQPGRQPPRPHSCSPTSTSSSSSNAIKSITANLAAHAALVHLASASRPTCSSASSVPNFHPHDVVHELDAEVATLQRSTACKTQDLQLTTQKLVWPLLNFSMDSGETTKVPSFSASSAMSLATASSHRAEVCAPPASLHFPSSS